jgi:hypothetical protein
MRAHAALGHLDAIRTLRRTLTRRLAEIDAEPSDDSLTLADHLADLTPSPRCAARETERPHDQRIARRRPRADLGPDGRVGSTRRGPSRARARTHVSGRCAAPRSRSPAGTAETRWFRLLRGCSRVEQVAFQ